MDASPDYHSIVIEGKAEANGERWLQASPPPPTPAPPPPDTATHAIVAAATLLIERKFIRGAALCGHVEDVVVDAAARGRGLGARVVAALFSAAREAGCYKIILDCSEDNVPFYERCGLARKEVQMVAYL